VSREAELGQLEARAQAAHLERLLYRARLQSRYIIIIHSIYNNVHRSCKYVQEILICKAEKIIGKRR
jgi:hypothetical protein